MRNGGFRWSRLDNAAKIFPSTTSRQDTKVFRFACELNETVELSVLQKALDQTMELFPFYRCTLHRGVFWYFFTESDQTVRAVKEETPPCSALYHPDRHDLLFAVNCYRCRINLEVYHAIADGTGALAFLKMLVYYYLLEKHPELQNQQVDMKYDASLFERMDDSFARYYSGKTKYPKQPVRKAYHLSGRKYLEDRNGIIEGVLSVKQVLAKAHEYHTTMSIFLCSVLFQAIYEQMPVRARQKPVTLVVPVNLRNYFQSESARNFFSVINVCYDFQKNPAELEKIIPLVAKAFQRELSPEQINGRLNELGALEHNLFARMVPLVLKDLALWAANKVTELGATAAFSNIGKIEMPPELAPYIRLFDAFTGTKRLQACLCSFGDNLTVSFTSPFVNTEVQRRFFRKLADMGMDVVISANTIE